MEEQNKNENSCDNDVQEEGLQGSGISQQVDHVSVEDELELVALGHLSVSGNLRESGLNTVIVLDN